MKSKFPLWSQRKHSLAFGLVLIVSFLLRLVLVLRGGQFYFPDEPHYFRSVDLVKFLVEGNGTNAIQLLVGIPEHTGFILLGCIPGAIQYLLNVWFGLSPSSTIGIPSLTLSLTSVASIALTAAIARRAGASEREALIAAVLMASATSIFYFSRHLVPYDLALALMLLTLWAGLDARTSFHSSFVCGVLASIAFFSYYGYWTGIGLVLLVHLFWSKPTLSQIIIRGVGAGFGFALFPIGMTLFSLLAGMEPYVLGLVGFAGTVSQGTFSEGWSLPWEYLWNAEHGLFIVWMAGLITAIALTIKQRGEIPARALLWLGIFIGVYGLLVLGSTILEKFVVYGRLARQLTPFLCLTAAFSIERFWERWQAKKYLMWVGVALLAIQVAINFAPPLLQQFPLDIERHVIANYGEVGRALTAKGPPVFGQDASKTLRYILVNAQYLYPISGTRKLPDGKTIFQANHPLQFLPYQFEGLDQGEREILKPVDLSMRLIDTR